MAKVVKKSARPKRDQDTAQVKKRVEGKIQHASELDDPLKALIYGNAKAGKTRLLATAPKVLLIDVKERGTKSTRRDIDPEVFPVMRWEDVIDVYWYLQEGDHHFESAAIDGVTAMQTLCMNFVLGEMHALDASRDPQMPSKQAWGKVSQLMKTQITNFKMLPMNVIFSALTRPKNVGDDDDEDMAVVTWGPAATPAVSGHLEAAVDLIGYLHKRQVFVKDKKTQKRKKVIRRRLILEGSERYLVGDRTGTFGDYVDAPDLTEMIEAINKTKET